MRRCLPWVVAVILVQSHLTASETVSGQVKAAAEPFNPTSSEAASKLHFLASFCFSNTGSGLSHFTIDADVRAGSAGASILLFDDTKWDKIWAARDSMSCRQAMAKAQGHQDVTTFVHRLPIGHFHREQGIIDHVRPHCWYVTAINCRGPIDLRYTITFTQPDGSQTSYDRQGVASSYKVGVMLFCILMVAHGMAHHWKMKPEYGAMQLTSYALGMLTGAALLKILHYHLLEQNGEGSPFLQGCGELIHAAGELVICAIFLMVANGWAVLQVHLSEYGAILICLLAEALTHAAFLFNTWFWKNPASVAYSYDSSFGATRVICQMAVTIYFGFAIRKTILGCNDAGKRMFMTRFACLGLAWFASLPLSVFIGTLLSPYLRATVIAVIRVIIDLTALSALVWLMVPSRCDVYLERASIPFSMASSYDNL